ncbi:MAG: hypothetical protein JO273_13335 [Methylobacteriaceae bacterium]|nr:hypothetical protein [Methylobacteriaceae bacterium]
MAPHPRIQRGRRQPDHDQKLHLGWSAPRPISHRRSVEHDCIGGELPSTISRRPLFPEESDKNLFYPMTRHTLRESFSSGEDGNGG